MKSNYPRERAIVLRNEKPAAVRALFVTLGLFTLIPGALAILVSPLTQLGDCFGSPADVRICSEAKEHLFVVMAGGGLLIFLMGLFTVITGSRRDYVFAFAQRFWTLRSGVS